MAATDYTPLKLYGSTTSSAAPSASNLINDSVGCEIAINVADKNLFFKDSTNTVNTVPIRQSSASSNGWLSSTDWSTFNGKAPAVTYISNYVPYGQGTTTPAQSSNFRFDGTNLVVSGAFNAGSTIRTDTGSGTATSFIGTGGSSNFQVVHTSGSNVVSLINSSTTYGQFAFGGSSTVLETTSSGNVKVDVGNLVIGTSGKGIDFSATGAGILWRTGVGSPEGVVTAAIGSLYTRSDGGVNTTLYVKQSGTGNTGWAAK